MRDHAASTSMLASALLAASGCGFDRTAAERTVLGGNTVLHSLEPSTTATDPSAPAEAPTVTMSREGWQPIDFMVPVDGTVHGPLWVWQARGHRSTPRQKALYPTADSALDLGPEGGASVRQAVVEPFLAVGNALALPVVVFIDPPGDRMSPSESRVYKRSVRGRPVAGQIPAPPAPRDP